MKDLKWVILASALSIAGVAFAGDLSIQPGMWEIHDKVVMKGVPYSSPPQTLKKCISPKEAKSILQDLQSSKQKNCHVSDVKVSGNDNPTHYHGVSDMTSTSGGTTMKIHVETTGRRLGSCK
jgi:hypothetical protein